MLSFVPCKPKDPTFENPSYGITGQYKQDVEMANGNNHDTTDKTQDEQQQSVINHSEADQDVAL